MCKAFNSHITAKKPCFTLEENSTRAKFTSSFKLHNTFHVSLPKMKSVIKYTIKYHYAMTNYEGTRILIIKLLLKNDLQIL